MMKHFINTEYQSLQLTEQEKDAIRAYKGMYHEIINNMLEPGIGNEEAFFEKSSLIEYDSETIKKMIKNVGDLYSALYKNLINKGNFRSNMVAYRGTTLRDIKRLRD